MQIRAINVNELFSEMFWKLKAVGVESDSRNGKVVRFPTPVMTVIEEPKERVLFHSDRDANPIFHLMESIWMLAGHNDVAFLKQFNSKIGQYSDDGRVFNAAYGHRMREQFGIDQLIGVIDHLTAYPESRQAVVQLWDAVDLLSDTLDRACNTQMVFAINNGKLDLTIFNRSNDMWYGYCGANPVHFSIIQEFVAIALGVEVGLYYTVSNNLHLYLDLYNAKGYLEVPPNDEWYDYYSQGIVQPKELYQGDYNLFLHECEVFCNDPFTKRAYVNDFFSTVAYPMAMVSHDRKHKISDGTSWADKISAPDWKVAVQQYIMKREEAKNVSK